MPAVFAARRLRRPARRRQLRPLPGPGQRARRRGGQRRAPSPSPTRRCRGRTLTGAPLSQAMLDVDRAARPASSPRAALGLPDDRFVIAVMGGSQGSGVLNAAIARAAGSRRRRPRSGRAPPRRRRASWTMPPPATDGIRRCALSAGRLRGRACRWCTPRRPADRPRWCQHGARGRGHRHTGDPRAVDGVGRGPPDRQRALARRTARRRSCSGRPRSTAAGVDHTTSGAPRRARRARRRTRHDSGTVHRPAPWHGWSSRSRCPV